MTRTIQQSYISENKLFINQDFRFTNHELITLNQDNQFTFFQRLNQEHHVFENIEILIIDSDTCFGYENDILKQFKKLKHVAIHGSKWWNLEMNQFPCTIESLKCTRCATLVLKKLWKGIETLIHLKTLHLDIWDMIDPENLKMFIVEKLWDQSLCVQKQFIPQKTISDWPFHLKTLILEYEIDYHQDGFENDEEFFCFRDHHDQIAKYPMFKNILSKIENTELKETYLLSGEMFLQSIIFFKE